MNVYTSKVVSRGNNWQSAAGAFTAWTNPSNVIANDAFSATCTIPASSRSNELTGGSFFTLSSSTQTYPMQGITLPALTVIDGIEVTVYFSVGAAASISDYSIYLAKSNGVGGSVNVGTNHAKAGTWGTGTLTTTYGSPTDLWGTTWTAFEATHSGFGASLTYQNTNVGSAVAANVQCVEITVYWHYKPADVYKRYQYKVYTRGGTYLGQLPPQSSIFSLPQDINTAGSMISVECPYSIDSAGLQSGGSLQDETGADLQDEAGNSLLTEGAVPLVSVGTGSGLIRNGNRLVVTEASNWYPNGRILFKGTIERWEASIGDGDAISLVAYSDGAELDNYVIKNYGTGATTVTYNSLDPSTGMLLSFMGDYQTAGGVIQASTSTVDATSLTLSYKMKNNTVLDGVNAMLGLSPAGFYWYVENGTNTLYFKNASTSPDVYLIKGRHIESFNLAASIENVVNYELFSGGDVGGGVNFYKAYSDSGSQTLYGVRLKQASNQNVTVTATADAIAGSDVANLKDEKFETTVTLSDSTIDTAALHVGLIIGFRGFGNFVDSLQMQIVRMDYAPDQTTLTLGILPKRMSIHTERIRRELTALQTLDNPTTPS